MQLPMLRFSTPQVSMPSDKDDKAACNVLKNFLNQHHCAIFWHNGTSDDECKVNGLHLHILMKNQEILSDHICRNNKFRTFRKKAMKAGAIVKTQVSKDNNRLIRHMHCKPRQFAGCTYSAFIKYMAPGCKSAKNYNENHLDPHDKYESGPGIDLNTDIDDWERYNGGDDETDNFFCSMIGWQQESSVNNKRKTDEHDEADEFQQLFDELDELPLPPAKKRKKGICEQNHKFLYDMIRKFKRLTQCSC